MKKQNYLYNIIVLAVVANKDDLYEHQEVQENEGRDLAKELNAIFQKTSAKETSGGVDILFKNIGKKFLDPNSEITSNLSKQDLKNRGDKLKRDEIKSQSQKKKGCC